MTAYVYGQCLGVRSHQRKSNNPNEQPKTDWFLGITSDKSNGFPGEKETTSIRISENHVREGLSQLYSQLSGKQILVPVFASGFAGRNGVVIEYWLSGDGKPLPSLGQPVKA